MSGFPIPEAYVALVDQMNVYRDARRMRLFNRQRDWIVSSKLKPKLAY
jgi:hypothetical protein